MAGGGQGLRSGRKGNRVLPGGRGGNFFSYFYFPVFSKWSMMNVFCFCLRRNFNKLCLKKKKCMNGVSGPLETECL